MPVPAKINVKERLEGHTIDLSLSQLQEVPVREIAAVKKGIILDLSNNRLISLGKNFSSLTHLVQLDLSKNLLRELPDDFGELTLLRRLDLYGNKLQHLPLSFSQLKALKWLDLKDNPLVPQLAEIAGPCEDTKDCEECAHNVVEALSMTALEVEEERKRRLKEQLREKEREEQELLAKKKELDTKKKNKNKKEKAKSSEKPPTPPSPARKATAKEAAAKEAAAKQTASKEAVVKETAAKGNATKQISAKERQAKDTNQRVKKGSQQSEEIAPAKKRDQSSQVRGHRKSKKRSGSLCTRLVLVFVWLFLFIMLAVVSIVTFALWDRPLFEISVSKLGLQGGAVAQFVLQKITGLTSNFM